MNFRGGFSIPHPEELQLHGCWIPITPQKLPISARSDSIPDNPQGIQVGPENWTQMVPNYNSLAQIFDTRSQVGRVPGEVGLGGNGVERNPAMNHIPNSYQQSLPGGSTSDWNNMPLMQLLLQGDSDFVVPKNSMQSRDLASERPLIPSSQPQASNVRVGRSSVGFKSSPAYRPEIVNECCQTEQVWIGSNSGNQLCRERIQSMGLELLDDGNVNGLTQIHRYDLPTPSKPSYDLNVSPAANAAHLENATNLLHFTPVTPDLGRSLEKLQSESRLISDESISREKEKSGNLVQCPDRAIQQNCDELLHNIVDSSSTLVSTPIKENRVSDKKSDLGIDLNETPQQKPPKRRKHRPKVVVEGKPKRTRKPAVLKNSESIENRPAKRKYVRKKLPQNSRAQEVDITRETTYSNIATAPKTCKRVLNFDLEETGEKNENNVAVPQETGNRNITAPEVTINHQSTDLSGTKTILSVQSDMPRRSESQISGKAGVSVFFNQMPNGYGSLQDRQTVVSLATTKEMEMSYFCPSGKHDEIDGNTNQQQTRKVDEHATQQHACAEGLGQHGLKGKSNLANLAKVNPVDLQKVKELMRSAFQPVPKTPSKSCEPRGLKRGRSQTAQQALLSTTDHMASLSNGNTFKPDEIHRNSHPLRTGQENDEKTKFGDAYRQIQNMPFYVKLAEGVLQTAKSRSPQDLNLMAQNMKQNYSSILNSRFENQRLGERGINDASKFTSDKYVHCRASGHNLPAQQTSPTAQSHPRKMGSTSAYSPHITLSENSKGQGHGQMFPTTYISTPENNLLTRAPRPNPALGVADKVQEYTPKRKGAKKKNAHLTTIDEIIYRLQILDLNGTSAGLQNTNQNALVLYKGVGTLAPYQDVDIIKRRKPRPKVDLDSETNRVWNLLMGKEGSENMEETDEKKGKWWDDERKVFRGRVDSFIARMHLVQGDRRFTRWKGSVVDSVIGVFLTQNVSDHLSSSAFMSMVARFPLKSRTQDEVKTHLIDTEVPISMINPDDAIKWYEVSSEPTNQNGILREPVQHQWGNDTTGTNRNITEAQNQSSEEELILSQDSFDSSITQVAGGIRSSSGSNSETEDPSTGCKPKNGQVSALTDYLQMEKSSLVLEVCSQVNGCTVLNGKSKYGPIEPSQPSSGTMKNLSYSSSTIPDNLYMQPAGPCRDNMLTSSRISELWLRESFSEESTSSWQSPPSRSTKGPEAVSKSSRTGEAAGSFDNPYNKEQNGPWWTQETPITSPSAFLSVDFNNQQRIPATIPNVAYNQSSCISYQLEGNNMFPVKSTFSMEPGNNAEALNKQNATMPNANKLTETTFGVGDCSSAVNLQICKENKMANSNEKISPTSHPSDLVKTRNSKPRKGNTESEKKTAVDWDDLRRKVKSNGRKTERPKDAMDSLDYEAVRMADVGKISDAIKERGMNNMLAERIKEFLNRVVRDHGSIDLEWLRDVPPDKAKDYLLSIRGLGLKSVECVRLLTLHHLAFPVDTNVGRIAVRLGWVPLQPLPESLQLHLLELYPILESIQKYLWPRLCKLDQRTLYELHYQMITFGKVFCTKSKPNCNACPMRGECRHFASAFASARLALPGPEERSIVSSTVPQTEDNNPGVVIHPMPLPAPKHSSVIEVGSSNSRKCEPIIEEPVTPEQECIAISESDIEDYNDPDEIPTIKLDENEFKENLQSYIRNNMELQEADMSKALVALSPDIASIPIPKLKNVSRLRTEHQVYELPDSHPLLERLDRREPDDPSPYLLAIWTPGESANSIQPSEKSCGSEPDKLCSNATCFSCNSVRESNSQTVRGTILIPCRTAMRGSFPLNGTYFQVNEMFADHESSINPINVPRNWIWNLPRRMVYFGTSVSTIFKGLSTQGIQYCFWKGFVCVRGFDQATRAPRPLMARLHFPASKLAKTKNDKKK